MWGIRVSGSRGCRALGGVDSVRLGVLDVGFLRLASKHCRGFLVRTSGIRASGLVCGMDLEGQGDLVSRSITGVLRVTIWVMGVRINLLPKYPGIKLQRFVFGFKV